MKLLVINSNAMFENETGIYIYKETGKFLNELNSAYDVENLHFKLPFTNNDGMANYDLQKTQIKITAIKRQKNKLLTYINAYGKALKSLYGSDFLYIFYPNSFSYLALLSIVLGKPFGLYIRGEKGILSSKSIFLYKHAKFILTVSPQFSYVVAKYNGKTETIRPMIEYSDTDIIRNRVYDHKRVYKFLYVGRIEIAKGTFELIEAFNILVKKGHNIKLYLVGDGENTIEIKGLVDKYGLGDSVVFFGSVYDREKIKSLYQEADVFILPTHHEGFPRVLYEAMIFGTPILTTFVGSIPYLMKDDVNCYKIEAKNINDIVEKMDMMIANYSKGAKVATNATETISRYLAANNETHSTQFKRLISEQA
jgi:glycosyltransferase involved in cell wall biosynthesis